MPNVAREARLVAFGHIPLREATLPGKAGWRGRHALLLMLCSDSMKWPLLSSVAVSIVVGQFEFCC